MAVTGVCPVGGGLEAPLGRNRKFAPGEEKFDAALGPGPLSE